MVFKLTGLISLNSYNLVKVYLIIGYNDSGESKAINYGFNDCVIKFSLLATKYKSLFIFM